MSIFRENRIRKFTIIMLVVTWFMFIILGYMSYIKDVQNNKEYFNDIGSYYTDLINHTLNELVLGETDQIIMISNNESIIRYCEQPSGIVRKYNSGNFIDKILENKDEYLNVEVISFEDPLITMILGNDLIIDKDIIFLDKIFFENHDFYISDVKRDEKSGIQYYSIIVPIYSKDKLVGAVSALIDLSEFTNSFVSNVRFRDTGYIFIANMDGSLIAHPLKDQINTLKSEMEETLKNIIEENKSGNNIVKSDFIGIEKYYYLNKVDFSNNDKGNQLVIIFTQEAKELFSSSHDFLKYMINIVITMVLLFAVLVLFYGKKYKQLISEDTKLVVEETLDYEVEKKTRELRLIAETDSLTKLYNHGAMYKIISAEINQLEIVQNSLSILMLDLDFFKNVNDTYGHIVGDEVLVEISELFKANIRDSDVAGRYGGEEFIIMLRETEIIKAIEVAERIRQSVEDREFASNKIRLTLSIGIAQLIDEDVSGLIKKADKLLYKSKENGRNKTSF